MYYSILFNIIYDTQKKNKDKEGHYVFCLYIIVLITERNSRYMKNPLNQWELKLFYLSNQS